MSYTPPKPPLLVSWAGGAEYHGPLGRVRASWQVTTDQYIFGPHYLRLDNAVPAPVLIWQQIVSPVGASPALGGFAQQVRKPGDYALPQYKVNASWLGASPYQRPLGGITATWSDDVYVGPQGIAAPDMPAPLVVQQLLISGAGGISGFSSGSKHFALLDWQYAWPQWVVNASWVGKDEYARPAGEVNGVWALPQEAKQVSLTGWNSAALGLPRLQRMRDIVQPAGLPPPEIPRPRVINGASALMPIGLASQAFGRARIYNWRQYILHSGFVAQLYGSAYVSGGVKEVKPAGLNALSMGAVKVVNTRASQTAAPQGIAWAGMGKPAVSPQILYAAGILGTVMGATRVQFPPHPVGWLSQAFGYPVVEYKTKIARPAGFDAFEPGYPRVRDRAQKVWPPSAPVTDVFGDVAVRLRTFKIAVPGIYAHEPNPWAELRNTRRFLDVPGLHSLDMGAASVRNKSPNLTPQGIDSQRFGVADIAGAVKWINPKGVPGPFEAFPAPVVWQTPSFTPKGIAAPAVGAHTVWMRQRAFDIGGFTTLRMGELVVDFGWRKVQLEGGGVAGAAYGEARVEHSYRAIAPIGWRGLAFGTGWISFGRRYLEPRSIEPVEISRHAIAGTQHLGPEGFEATRWLTRIIPESQDVYPKTFGAAYGWPTVDHKSRYLKPEGIVTGTESRDRWGLSKVWNLRQYITQQEDAESLLWPPGFAPWLKVENRDKTIGSIGYVATRYGRAQADNNARLLQPAGIAKHVPPEYQKSGTVTHGVRFLPLDGMESPLMSRWAVVWNKAFPLRAVGLEAALFGTAQVVNTRRYRSIQGLDSAAMGSPFVAFAMRGLTFESRYGIAPPIIALPDVHLNTRYVDVPGIDGAVRGQIKLGLPIVESRFNKVVTRWTHKERTGEPIVRNTTPELRPRNWLDAEFGTPDVRLQWRPIAADGRNMALFGKTRIADRLQKVEVPGFNTMRFGDKMTVRRYGIDPVVTQYIDLRKFVISSNGMQYEASEGFGIAPALSRFGAPDVSKGYVYPDSKGTNGDMHAVGKPVVTANSIRVEPGYWDLLVGEPTVSLKDRVLEVSGIGPLIIDSTIPGNMGSWGLPRLSPHTIYAVMEATDQAKLNHGLPLTPILPVNAGEVFGAPRVALGANNVLGQYAPYEGGSGYLYVGNPTVYNLLQGITAYGWNALRLGLVKIPGPQTIEHEEGVNELVFGVAAVDRPPYVGPLSVAGQGLNSATFGEHGISHFHRQVSPLGFSSLAMGYSRGLEPNMPNDLHVGPPNLHQQIGFDAAAYGSPWVSHRIRELQMPGWDSFLCEYDYQNFSARMRVRRTGESSVQWQVVGARGFVDTAMGTPNVRPGVHYIRPDGNSDQFRKGVPTS